MNVLGPLSSLSGSRRFFVDFSPQLDTSELLSTTNVTPDNNNISISSVTILSSDITTKDGSVLGTGKTLSFIASASGGENIISSLVINYTTDGGNQDTSLIKIKLQPQII